MVEQAVAQDAGQPSIGVADGFRPVRGADDFQVEILQHVFCGTRVSDPSAQVAQISLLPCGEPCARIRFDRT
jgi:hypothetical protein